MRTRVKYQKHDHQAEGHSSHIVRKWGVTGKVSFSPNGNCATITVEEWPHDNRPFPVRLPTHDHEMGHVEFFEDRLINEPGIKFKDLMDVDTWQCEVDAWLRGLETPFPLEVGMFALDCLWTYAVGCNVPESDWAEAKATFAESCLDEEALLDYVPEPVPPGEEGAAEPGFDMEGEEFPEGDEGDGLPDDGDNYDGLPDGEMPEGEELPGDGGRNEQGGDISERDAWLLDEGMQYVRLGSSAVLKRELKARGYKVEAPLPAVAKAVFRSGGGVWQWN